ncbi:phage portal protein [Collinsella sp. AGMB00827]|uniref:Phage portal protein n=1 Tax=Collinsella ureilytica TaxID=2869515 RepID=A0ABS7MK68_9ACTN|nr:phage portal protein [Collinsella urealyticum]MBY4796790.1 phage portal protein [Collinsella urealyticum]
MGIISAVLAAATGHTSLPAIRPAPYPMLDLAGGADLPAADRAYHSNAFRACLLAKARPLSALPADVYTREKDVRKRAESRVARALSELLRHRWNPLMTSAEGVRWTLMTKDTLGNAFIRVEWSQGVPVALWPMRQGAEPKIENGRLTFQSQGDRFTKAGAYLPHEVVWVKSPVIDADGFKGVSLAELSARELGLSIDLEEFYNRLISNGNHFPGWLETDRNLSQADIDKIRRQLSDRGGIVYAGEVRLFDNNLKYHQTPLTMADMSLVEQERWILQQVCRTTSVPPQEVFELSNATYSNIEQGALNFASKTLMPECHELEKAFSGILWSAGKPDEYVQFDMNGLLRGDYKSRMEGYRTAIMGGWMSPNKVLAKEDEAPFTGGDVYFRSAAYIPVNPETGEELAGARRSGEAKPGGSGEGEDPSLEKSGGRPKDALEIIHADMEQRLIARFAEQGDVPKAREFACRVLLPYQAAMQALGEEYDMECDIERIAQHARH